KERIAGFASSANRSALVEAAERQMLPLLRAMQIGETYAPANQKYAGARLKDIAKAEGRAIADVMLDIAIRDELRTEFQLRGGIHADPEIVAEILGHPLVHIGASDAGAHVSQF